MAPLFRREGADRLASLLERPSASLPLPPPLPHADDAAGREARAALVRAAGHTLVELEKAAYDPSSLQGNIENYVGVARVPVGLVGPLRVRGVSARGDFTLPLATTEGALIASYNRGAKAVSRAGGIAVACVAERVQRSPGFEFPDLGQAARFVSYALDHVDDLVRIAAGTTRHGVLVDVDVSWDVNNVVLVLSFETGDASGQNMVTLAAEAVARHLVDVGPVKPARWFVEANMFGEKKASHLALTGVRGKKVLAEAIVSAALVQAELHVTVEDCAHLWRLWTTTGIESGSVGVQGHYANGLAALFIACGQDVAAVAEAAVGVTRVEATAAGDLRISVNLPNLIVGTVGGGTALPTQHECLALLGCVGTGGSRKFAELAAALVLAGELSAVAAMASGEFARAHARLGRKGAP